MKISGAASANTLQTSMPATWLYTEAVGFISVIRHGRRLRRLKTPYGLVGSDLVKARRTSTTALILYTIASRKSALQLRTGLQTDIATIIQDYRDDYRNWNWKCSFAGPNTLLFTDFNVKFRKISATIPPWPYLIFTARQTHCKRCIGLRYGKSIRHPGIVKIRERGTMLSSPSGSPVSSFLTPGMVDGGRSCPGKIWVQRWIPCENSRAVHLSPHNSGTVADSEKKFNQCEQKVDHGLSNEPPTKIVHP